MTKRDFGLDELDDDAQTLAKRAAADGASKPTKAACVCASLWCVSVCLFTPRRRSVAKSVSDELLLRELNESLGDVAFAGAVDEAQSIQVCGGVAGACACVRRDEPRQRDVAAMSVADKREFVERESPELLQVRRLVLVLLLVADSTARSCWTTCAK